ncbi:MAG: hypothetical protein OXI74_05770 [Rhodospirillaceae bacterium]|nr:hypothetical protein [Rhodospirillaceae bacterium]
MKAIFDITQDNAEADERLMADVLRDAAYHHNQRIGRLQAQIAFRLYKRQDLLYKRQDLLESINDYNINNLDILLEASQQDTNLTPGDIIHRALTNRHRPKEAEYASHLLLSIANLQAIQQLQAEAVTRSSEDPVWWAYQHAIIALGQDTQYAAGRREYQHPEPDRIAALGLEQLAARAEQADLQVDQIIQAHRDWLSALADQRNQQTSQRANTAMPDECDTQFALRPPTDAELAAICDGARLFTSTVARIGKRALQSGDNVAANAARLVMQQFCEQLELHLADRVEYDEFDSPDERTPTETRFERTLQPARELLAATDHVQHLPVGHGQEAPHHLYFVVTAALMGHASTLRWHVKRIQDSKPNQRHDVAEHATASWIHENVITRILENGGPSLQRRIPRPWNQAKKALEQMDDMPEEIIFLHAHRPSLSSPSFRTNLDLQETFFTPPEASPEIHEERHQMPHDWPMSYNYQDAHYSKRIGEPYFHEIDSQAAKGHAIKILEQGLNGRILGDEQARQHLEDIAVVSYALARAALQYTSGPKAFAAIPRSTAIHRIIDPLALDQPAKDGGNKFGRLARAGLMEDYVLHTLDLQLSGIRAED